jgi:ribonuclease D
LTIKLHQNDLPDGLDLGPLVAIDTETMGLKPERDRLCLVQLSSGNGLCHAVQIQRGRPSAPNLIRMLGDPATTKLFHFARFDIAILLKHLGVLTRPVYCTKVASKLVRTFTDKHGLKELAKELLGVELSKQQQSSDWGASQLSEEQLRYAASDVLHLHALKAKLDDLLAREGRSELARRCFEFLPTRSELDLLGWAEEDLFQH